MNSDLHNLTIETGVKRAFETALPLPTGYNVESSKYGELACWDSTAHMVLVAELEATFDIMLSTDDVLSLSSYDRAIEIVAGLTSAGDFAESKP